MSAFVAELIQDRLADTELARLWDDYLTEVGVTEQEIATADQVLDTPIATAFRWTSLDVADLTCRDGRLVGQLAASGTADVVAAHIAVLARERSWPIVTSDPDDLHQVDPTLVLHAV